LEDILKQGFKGVEGKVESAAPKHLRSALGQTVNFFYTLQGEAAGAQAISSFDTLLAPFVRYDNLDYKEIKQALQEFVFNINIPTRVGFQTPFTNITMDLYVPSILKDHPVIIGGVEKDETYSDFQPEMDMLNRAFAEVMMEGDAKGRVFTFPIPTYNITADFDWDNPNFEPIWKMTGKYGVPYFSNFV
ncbi:MAG: ribonucleoside triphosphate reductase, partial [Proteobacteria bacterium]|nr:ribonucleoside triphosphate reductase [Pseudomonadota bacterium]